MLSAYQCSIGVTTRALCNRDALLRKSAAHALAANFFFQVAIAHGLLRNQEVPVGEADCLGRS